MEHEPRCVNWLVVGLPLLALVTMSGCDYWPPALQTQIETLRADLEDAMDERQRLGIELSDLKNTYALAEQEAEDRSRQNAELERRLSAVNRRDTQLPTSVGSETSRRAPLVPTRTPFRANGSPRSPIQKGSLIPLMLTYPAHRGPKVVQLQRLLRRHDLLIHLDGIYGPATHAAVRSFQRVHNLSADGIVGPATYSALRRPEPTPRLVRQIRHRPPLTLPEVYRIQRSLRRAGYHLPLDGRFGPETDHALTRFQRTHGLDPDGIVGPKTLAALKATR